MKLIPFIRVYTGLITSISFMLCTPIQGKCSTKTLNDYRHFRALTIDLLGRMPTYDEIKEFEKKEFNLEQWLEHHFDTSIVREDDSYVTRMTRFYMDILRLELGPAFAFAPAATSLHRASIEGPNGDEINIFYRWNQRRTRPETDGEFCLSSLESGLQFANGKPAEGTRRRVPQALLDQYTVKIRPWWLYRDYRNAEAVLRYRGTWQTIDKGYAPVDTLLFEKDRKTPILEVRVCREEAQINNTGTIFAANHPKPVKGTPHPYGRSSPLPQDDAYIKKHKGEPISCTSPAAHGFSVDCGCGIGLERCIPGDNTSNDPRAFILPTRTSLGLEHPLASAPQTQSQWHKLWWSQEAVQFLNYIFKHDRDFREILTAKYTLVNGPLTQFYRSGSPANCCGRSRTFGLIEEGTPLFDISNVPPNLLPHDIDTWVKVEDRGPLASGLLTMPIFLTKYASQRARGATLYNAFLCKSFAANNVTLTPSTEPNLMLRPGCQNCHQTLEPLAAYFTRVIESDWTFLPQTHFPLLNPTCKNNKNGKPPGFCNSHYDPAFATHESGMLRGAYGSLEHAEQGPVGAGLAITTNPDFASCVVNRVASSFLGRPLTHDDATLTQNLEKVFINNTYRMKPLVRAIVQSASYIRANNFNSDNWRQVNPHDNTPN